MSNILIIKTGSTFTTLAGEKGDFEDWILEMLEWDRDEVDIVDVSRDEPLPDYEDIPGIIITGSHAMITQRQSWVEQTAEWLRRAVEQEIPLLGICFGHHLLAYAMGGEVGDNPKGREFGTVEVKLTAAAEDDHLFGDMAEILWVHESHSQSVLKLPPGATCLASSDKDPNQAFAIGGCAWGLQFHPEFDAEILNQYINFYSHVFRIEGIDVDEVIKSIDDTPHGRLVLDRFAEIIEEGCG